MHTNERVKALRKALNLSQEAFGEKLGVKKSAVSKIEKGENGLKEPLAKLICKTFNADYFWLTEGKREMFTRFPDTLTERLASDYNIDDFGLSILKAYANMKPEQQQTLKDFLLSIAENIKNGE